jgi:hypothetical protein
LRLEATAKIIAVGLPESGRPPDELSVAFADEESPVYDEYVPWNLLELREHVGALIARFEPRFGR